MSGTLDDAAASSPCTGICTIDPATGWCEGCARTIDEIVDWPFASPAERAAILEELARRKA